MHVYIVQYTGTLIAKTIETIIIWKTLLLVHSVSMLSLSLKMIPWYCVV